MSADDGWRSCSTCPAPRDCKTHGCGVVRKLWPAESLAGKGPLITFWEDGSVTVDDRPAGEFPFKPETQ